MPRTSASISPAYLARHGITPPRAPAGGTGRGKAGAEAPGGTVVFTASVGAGGVSVNQAYANAAGGGRVSTQALKNFKAFAEYDFGRTGKLACPIEERRYSLRLVVHGPWELADGRPAKRDVSNFIKAAEDALCAYLGIDDRWIYHVEAQKAQNADAPRIDFMLTAL